MEFLIKQTVTALFFVFVFCSASSQVSQEKLQEAFARSYVLEKSSDFKASIGEIKKVYDSGSYEINLRLGWLTFNSGQMDESVNYYEIARKLMPYSEESRFGLILPETALARWDEVISIYNEILEINPGNSVALYRLGMVYYNRKNYSKVYPLFKKVVNLYPFGYDGLLMLGWTSFFLGNYNEAKVLFNKVNLYNPGDKSAQEGLKLIK
jgi:tetratricopeptide (TPR) repeat protein